MSTEREEAKFLTPKEAADELRVHRTTITRLVQDGKLAGTRIGTRLVIARDAIDAFVDRNTTPVRDEAFDPKVRAPKPVPPDREALRQRYDFLRPQAASG